VVNDHTSFNLFVEVDGSEASTNKASRSGVLCVAIVGTSALGGSGCYFLCDVTPQFIAALNTAAILSGIKTLVSSLLATNPAIAVGVFAVVRVIVTMHEGVMGTEVLPFGAVVTHRMSFRDKNIIHQD
jgi:hypothetical protein